MKMQFILDYRSPYAYLANTQIMSMGVQITYEPVEIVSIMKRVNNQPSPMCPPKVQYAGLDAARWAKHYGVPYSPNGPLLDALRTGKVKSDLLSRAGIAAQRLGAFQQVNDALFSAIWTSSDELTSASDRLNFLTSHDSRRNCGTSRKPRKRRSCLLPMASEPSRKAYLACRLSSSMVKCSSAMIDWNSSRRSWVPQESGATEYLSRKALRHGDSRGLNK